MHTKAATGAEAIPEPAGTGAKQDEYLISPAVQLSGTAPVLQFDYAFGRYELFAGAMQFTVEASTDGAAPPGRSSGTLPRI